MTQYDNTKTYNQYVDDVLNGKRVAGQYIKLSCARYKEWFNRDDIYFDYEDVDRKIRFVSKMKHSTGVHAGKPFILLPWQQFVFAGIYGWKWKTTGYRVTKNVLIEVSRKCGKTALCSAIALVQTIMDNEPGAEIDFVANSAQQARIAFGMSNSFSKSLDPKSKLFHQYRDNIKIPATNSTIQVLCSDSMGLDGYNSSCFVIDEFHAQKTWDLYNVLKSSQGMRTQPLAIVITTAGFLLDGYPLYELRATCIDILKGMKTDDTQFSTIFELDDDDDYKDETNWEKCTPSINQTVYADYMREQIKSAENNPSLEVGVLTKTFNRFCASENTWIGRDTLISNMKKLKLEDYKGMYGYVGVDLASVSDLSSVSLCIPTTDRPVFFNWAFIPEETYVKSPNHTIYEKFKRNGHLIVTPGNVTDFDYIRSKIHEINETIPIQTIYYDAFNATSWAIDMTEDGFFLEPFSQALGNYNKPTKEFERLVLMNRVTIDYNECVLWCFSNVALKTDFNENVKPIKGGGVNGKIDCVIGMLTGFGGLLNNPNYDARIWVV